MENEDHIRLKYYDQMQEEARLAKKESFGLHDRVSGRDEALVYD